MQSVCLKQFRRKSFSRATFSNVATHANSSRVHPTGRPSLIQFVGKRSHVKSSHSQPTVAPTVAPSKPIIPTSPAPSTTQSKTITEKIWSRAEMEGYNAAWFGRPSLSKAELEAVESGGATIVF